MDRSLWNDVSAKTRTTNVEQQHTPAGTISTGGSEWVLMFAVLGSLILPAFDKAVQPVWFRAGVLLGAAFAKLLIILTGLEGVSIMPL